MQKVRMPKTAAPMDTENTMMEMVVRLSGQHLDIVQEPNGDWTLVVRAPAMPMYEGELFDWGFKDWMTNMGIERDRVTDAIFDAIREDSVFTVLREMRVR